MHLCHCCALNRILDFTWQLHFIKDILDVHDTKADEKKWLPIHYVDSAMYANGKILYSIKKSTTYRENGHIHWHAYNCIEVVGYYLPFGVELHLSKLAPDTPGLTPRTRCHQHANKILVLKLPS